MELMNNHKSHALDQWMTSVKADNLPALHTFVTGLGQDLDAVVAGLSLRYSSGAVEGHNNKIKMLKRQMFGRANCHAGLGQAGHLRHAQGGQAGLQQAVIEGRCGLRPFGRSVLGTAGVGAAGGVHHAGAVGLHLGLVQEEVLDGSAEGGVFDQGGPSFGARGEDAPRGVLAELMGHAQPGSFGDLPPVVLGVLQEADERGEGVLQYRVEEGGRCGRLRLGVEAVAVGVPAVDDPLQVGVVQLGKEADSGVDLAGELAVVGESASGGVEIDDGDEVGAVAFADYAAVILAEGSGSDYGDAGFSHR